MSGLSTKGMYRSCPPLLSERCSPMAEKAAGRGLRGSVLSLLRRGESDTSRASAGHGLGCRVPGGRSFPLRRAIQPKGEYETAGIGDNPMQSRRRFRVPNPADLTSREAQAAYRVVSPQMAAGHGLSEHPVALAYLGWPRFGTVPCRSASHGRRYTTIMPVGTIFGTTKGVNAAAVGFCVPCHLAAERNDHPLSVPLSFRRGTVPAEKRPGRRTSCPGTVARFPIRPLDGGQ